MENKAKTHPDLILKSYERYYPVVCSYIYYKINCKEEAEDLAQDVFLRLMEYEQLICEATVRSFIYTISRNIITDYLRHHYKRQELNSYMYEEAKTNYLDGESAVIARDLQDCELKRVSLLPRQRRTIYLLTRFRDYSVTEISTAMRLSRRTVERHLYVGRKEIRGYLRKIS